MTLPTILRGADTAAMGAGVSVALPEGRYDGMTVRLEVCGAVREWVSPASGATLTAHFSAAETALWPLGAHMARISVSSPSGASYALDNALRVIVTDDPSEAASGGVGVPGPGEVLRPGDFADVADIGPNATQRDLRERLAEIISILKGGAAALALLVLAAGCAPSPAFAADTVRWEDVPPGTPVDTNAVAGAVDLSGYATTGEVARVAAAIPDVSGFLSDESDPTVPVWAKAPAPPLSAESDPAFAAWADGEDGGTNNLVRIDQGDLELQNVNAFFQHVDTVTLQANDWEHVTVLADDGRGLSIAELHQNIELDIEGMAEDTLAAANNYADEAAAWAASAATAGLPTAADLAAVRADASLVHQMLVGSNVVMEVTNYNSRVRSPAMRILQLSESNEYFTVWAETNGLARTLEASTNFTATAVAALAAEKADRAWSRHTSGLGADAPQGATWISTPVTVVSGGYEYERVATAAGEAWVLCSNGLALGGDTNAFLHLSTGDGTALVSIERTESVLVGVSADGITVDGNQVSIPLSVVSSEPPVCYASNDLSSGQWTNLSEESPAWISSASCSGAAGAWTWTITTSSPRAFFQFRALQEGQTVIRNHGWTDLSGGVIVDGVHFVPTVSGTAPNRTLTWTEAR